MFTRDSHHYLCRGKIIVVDTITATAAEWDASPQAAAGEWSVIRDHGTVRACRLRIPGPLRWVVPGAPAPRILAFTDRHADDHAGGEGDD